MRLNHNIIPDLHRGEQGGLQLDHQVGRAGQVPLRLLGHAVGRLRGPQECRDQAQLDQGEGVFGYVDDCLYLVVLDVRSLGKG